MESFIPPSDIPPLEYEQNNDAGDVYDLEGNFFAWKTNFGWRKFIKIHQFLDSFEEIKSNEIDDLDESDFTLGKTP